jgi:hypothetical protein
MASGQKLTWFKSLRGADLTDSEFRIYVLLANYSGKEMENAYPSVAMLAADSGMTGRGVQNILKRLVAKGAIEVTREGGNQVRKGAATVYKILTPPRRPKGDTDDTLQDGPKGESPFTLEGEPPFTLQEDSNDTAGGDKSGSKGEPPYAKGEPPRPGRVNPRSPHQVINQVNKHHSAHEFAASLAPQPTAHPDQVDDDNDDYDVEAFLEELNDELGLDQTEMNAAEAMWQRGMHPNAVRNTINQQRLGRILNDVNQDQKRLDEGEPRCTVQGCRQPKSKHTQWMAMLDETDRHDFAPHVSSKTP